MEGNVATTPTKRTLDYLKQTGLVCGVVEKWQATPWAGENAGVRIDLFNFIDIIALDRASNSIIGVQSTSMNCKSAHRRKILTNEHAPTWLECGGRIMLICWKKYAKPVERKYWRPNITWITTEDFDVRSHATK